MLSVAAAALLSGPAYAVGPTTITTVVTTAQTTSTTGNLTINSGAGISFKSATVPDLTIDSSNTVNNGGAISADNQDTATAVQIDANGLTGSFLSNGTISLAGTGTGKTAIHLDGAGSFTGDVTLDTGSVVTIAGDDSNGILTDAGSVLNGDLLLSGSFQMTPTTANSTSASGNTLIDLNGTINGNLLIGTGANYQGVGNGAQGILVVGAINGCNTTAVPGCTEIGTLANSGTLSVVGVATRSATGTNAESGSAIIVENSIAGGIINNGPIASTDTANVTATISGNGTGTAPTILITPNTTVPTAINIGPDMADAQNGGYNFINRGTISASPEDNNVSTRAIVIGGASSAPVTFVAPTPALGTGGLFDSGVITASATSVSPGSQVVATAIEIDNYVTIPKIYVSAQSAGTSGTEGTISATITGPQGGVATAILIAGAPVGTVVNTHVPEIDIERGARVIASATASEATGTTIATLSAVAIQDVSNSLVTLNNAGTISATATLTDSTTGTVINLTNGSTPTAHAVDTQMNSLGLNFTNTGFVNGDILLGNGSDTYFVQGTGPSSAMAGSVGAINFGFSNADASAGGSGYDTLHVGQYANVAGIITAQGTLNIQVDGTGILSVKNVASTLQANNLTVAGGNSTSAGTLNITVSEGSTASAAVIASSGTVTFYTGANLGVTYGSFIPSQGSFVLISAPTGNLNISPADIARYSSQVDGTGTTALPFLFNSASIAKVTNVGGMDELVLTVNPKTIDQLGLTGNARRIYTLANTAVASDDTLGAAVVAGIASNADAQRVYDAFAPDVSGGARAIGISLTDQATGVVASRERMLRLFAKEPGDLTLWGNEFGEYIDTHGQSVTAANGLNAPTGGCTPACATVPLSGFKDHGFGFSLGIDEGSPAGGWYGAAFSFYTGDINENGDRDSKTNSLWYMLTGYSTWRGRGLFVDTQATVGYVNLKGKRFLDLTIPTTGSAAVTTFQREADGKRAGLLAALGATFGAQMRYGGLTAIPQLSIDGFTMRQEGFTETGGGTGFNLAVKPFYSNSLRAFLGSEFRGDINLGDFLLQPSARIGYRFDFLKDPAKITASFADVNSAMNGAQAGTAFTLEGPDPSRGNAVLGAGLNATTDNWTIGLDYNFIRGTNNATEQVGTLSLLGRI